MFVRRLARPMLGSIFVVAGSEGVRHPAAAAPAAEPLVNKTLQALPKRVSQYLPRDPESYVRINGATQLLAGMALASGRLPRISSLVLAGTLVPTTLAGHPFWQESDPALKAQQKIHFWKNVSILGGLIIAGIDTEGRPGLSWRARRAAGNAATAVASALPGNTQSSHALADRAHEFADTAQSLAEKAGERLSEVSAALGAKTAELGETARERAPIIAEYARERGSELARTAQHRGAELAEIASQRGSELADRATQRRDELANAAAKGRAQVEALAAEQRPKLRRFVRPLRG